ncbi:EP153R [African swine fever virus]|nr:EP153R [African swine fever virus]
MLYCIRIISPPH